MLKMVGKHITYAHLHLDAHSFFKHNCSAIKRRFIVGFDKLTRPLHQLTPFPARISFVKTNSFNIYSPIEVGKFFNTIILCRIDVSTITYRTSRSACVRIFFFASMVKSINKFNYL